MRSAVRKGRIWLLAGRGGDAMRLKLGSSCGAEPLSLTWNGRPRPHLHTLTSPSASPSSSSRSPSLTQRPIQQESSCPSSVPRRWTDVANLAPTTTLCANFWAARPSIQCSPHYKSTTCLREALAMNSSLKFSVNTRLALLPRFSGFGYILRQ